ncbi:MAG: phosphoglycerate kinase, partial [Acidithiobacillus sp.]|nr:phosphoglycerate kinase [Acidithiobacillus sp.]
MTWITMNELSLRGKKVLIREDLNVPLNANGSIADDHRIQASLETLQLALRQGAKVLVMSHLGRPVEGVFEEKCSLQVVAHRLAELLGRPVPLVREWIPDDSGATSIPPLADGDIVLLENVRFHPGEKADNPDLSQRMASLCDIFVMDAFASAHRAQASTHGVARFAPIACAGPLLSREITALNQAIQNPKRPVITLIGGAKIGTKLGLLQHLIQQSDRLLVGGGIANTLLLAKGIAIGKSLVDRDLLAEAQTLLQQAEKAGRPIPLPRDVVLTKAIQPGAALRVCPVSEIGEDELIADIGPQTFHDYQVILQSAQTTIWNGPFGIAEIPEFATGTQKIIETIAESQSYSLVGGGDTVAALHRSGLSKQISYISTGGGAFLTYLEGKP